MFKVRFLILLLPSLLLIIEGCSRATRSPVILAGQISGADNAILWDWGHMDHVKLTGGTVTQLVHVVSSARGGSN